MNRLPVGQVLNMIMKCFCFFFFLISTDCTQLKWMIKNSTGNWNAIWDKFLQCFMHSKYVRIYNSVNTDSEPAAFCLLFTWWHFIRDITFFMKPQHVRSSSKENVRKKSFEPISAIIRYCERAREEFFLTWRVIHEWLKEEYAPDIQIRGQIL